MPKKLIHYILTSWLLFSSLYLPALAENASPAGATANNTPIKKTTEAQFLEGKTCLAQSNLPCTKLALALMPSASPYAKILEGALALQLTQTEQALLVLLPIQADETLIAPAKIMLQQHLALAFANLGDVQQAVQHLIVTESLLNQDRTDSATQAIAENQSQIWQLLQPLKHDDLITLRGNNTDNVFQGWVDLTLAYQHADRKVSISNWRSLYADHPALAFSKHLSEKSLPEAQSQTTLISNATIALVLTTASESDTEKLQAFKLGLETAANLAGNGNSIEVYYQDQHPQEENISADYFIVPDFAKMAPAAHFENINGKPHLYASLPLQDEASAILNFARQHHMQHLTVITTQHETSQPILASIQAAWPQFMHAFATESPHIITLDADVLAQPVKLLDLKSQIASIPHDMVILAMSADDIVKIRPYLDISTPTMTLAEIHDIALENDNLKLLNALRFVDIPLLLNPSQFAADYLQAAENLSQKSLVRWFAMGADSLQLLDTTNKKNHHAALINGLAGSYQLSESGELVRLLSHARFNQTGATSD